MNDVQGELHAHKKKLLAEPAAIEKKVTYNEDWKRHPCYRFRRCLVAFSGAIFDISVGTHPKAEIVINTRRSLMQILAAV